MKADPHGSTAVMAGKVRGATDTDYFYFFCQHCPGEEMLQVPDFKFTKDGPVEYAPEERPGAKRDFIIAFSLSCHQCGFEDVVKVSNIGWQGGQQRSE